MAPETRASAAIAPGEFRGMPAVHLAAPDGARAIVMLHGAQVVSWQPARGGERLYLSERSAFAPRQAIRGGIPVIFPQFADFGPLPRHGFARSTAWTLLDAHRGRDFACAVLALRDDATTRAIWPHAFRAELTVVIGADRLDVEFEVENSGEAAFAFTGALHSYLRVDEVEDVALAGLRGTRYLDRSSGSEITDSGVELRIDRETDRIHYAVARPLLLRQDGASLGIDSEGFPDVVVWNPWEHKCAALADMAPTDFRHMLCVEAAVCAAPVQLDPGACWWGRQSFEAL